MTWGPDGWLYGARGAPSPRGSAAIEFQQAIWRYHPRDRRFEVFAEGGGNTWGLDFDPAGNAFGSSNGAYITFHMVQGGYYLKGFAKHGPLHNPHAYGYFGPIAYRGPKHGGHVTPGGIIYKGDAFPPSFRGTFIGGNLLSNAVYWHVLKRDGSTFAGRHGGTLIDARDRWFRPIDLLAGPDAAVYVVDWYDKRAAHLDPRDTWDRTNGRIYRVVLRRAAEARSRSTCRNASSAELVALRTSTNDWFPAEARRHPGRASRCDDRARAEAAAGRRPRRDRRAPRPLGPARQRRARRPDGDGAARSSRRRRPAVDDPPAGRRPSDERGSSERSWSELAATEPDAMVRSQLASSGQRWEADDALPILGRLARRDEDVGDPHIPNLLWWAFERQLRQDRDAVVELLCTTEMQRAPLVEQALLETGSRGRWSPRVPTATSRPVPGCWPPLPARSRRRGSWTGMEQGLRGPDARARARCRWRNRCRGSGRRRSRAPGLSLIRLAARMGSPAAIAAAVDLARDPRAAGSTRDRR